MPLPKYLTTVTPMSKYLAMFLFIIFPFISFFIGMNYQSIIDQYKQKNSNQNTVKIITPVLQSNSTASPSPTIFTVPKNLIPTGIPLAHDGYFSINQWHLRTPYNGSLSLEYSPAPSNEWPRMYLSSAQLNAGGPKICNTAEGAAGYITRLLPTDEIARGETTQQFISQDFKASNSVPPIYTKIGNYYYIYSMDQADNCSNTTLHDQTVEAFEAIIPHLTSY